MQTRTCPTCGRREAAEDCTLRVEPVPHWFFVVAALAYGPVFFGWLTHLNAARTRILGHMWTEAGGALAAALLAAAVLFPLVYLLLVARLARGLFGHIRFAARLCGACVRNSRAGGAWWLLALALLLTLMGGVLFAFPLTFNFPGALVGLLLVPYALLGRGLLRLGVVDRRLLCQRMTPDVVTVRVSAPFARVVQAERADLLRDRPPVGRRERALAVGAPVILGTLVAVLAAWSPALRLPCPYGTLPAAWTTDVRETGCMAPDASQHGAWQGRDAAGMLLWEATYFVGRRHGRWTEWSQGRKTAEGAYVRGQRHGPHVQYAPDGSVANTVVYKRGRVVTGN